jgi:hypothetical protein
MRPVLERDCRRNTRRGATDARRWSRRDRCSRRLSSCCRCSPNERRHRW